MMNAENKTQLNTIMTDKGNRYKSINGGISTEPVGNEPTGDNLGVVIDSKTREEVRQFRKTHYRYIYPDMDLDNDPLDDNALTLYTRNTEDHVDSTARLGLDRPLGFPQERYLKEYRKKGTRLIELGRFIIDEGNLILLKSYYRGFYSLALNLQCDAIVMSMQPRHIRFHQRLTGLQIIAKDTESYGGPHSLACVIWEINATLPKFFEWIGEEL